MFYMFALIVKVCHIFVILNVSTVARVVGEL